MLSKHSDMEKTKLYESPDLSVLTLAAEQGFAQSANIESLTIVEEEW